jgi:beta-lactamase regulating signal transducer with metallopeptidase domain
MLTILAEAALRSFVLGSAVWLGLTVFRVRNPHVHMASWIVVLAASLAMPLLMHWTKVTITLQPLPVPVADHVWPTESSLPEALRSSLPPELGIAIATHGETYSAIDWWTLATAIYACVAGVMLLRLAVGIRLTWRLVRSAKPIREGWVGNADVRLCDQIGGPVTFGSTILLPPQCIDWDAPKREAVLAHEGTHVANGDFYVLLLASLNRAAFWFSPFAWWQLGRLAELAEIISDAQAIEVLNDRLSYAELLLELVQSVRQKQIGLQMARIGTVGARIERILAAVAVPAAAVSQRVGWRKRFWIAAGIVPLVIVSAGTIAYRMPPAPELAAEDASKATSPGHRPQHVEFYAVAPTSIFAVFRDGDDLSGQLTGQPRLHLALAQDGTYSYPAAAGQMTFAVGDERQSSELKLHQNGRDLRAARIVEMPRDGAEPGAALFDEYAGWYELGPTRVLAVTRNGYRLHVQETGRSGFEAAAIGTDAFSSRRDDFVIFLRDGHAEVTRVLLQDPMSGARLARRVDAARAKAVEAEFARRVVEISDRFREQAPTPGSKDAILRGIEDLRRGAPNYERMSASLAARIRRQVPELQAMFVSLGAVESIFFRGVGPGGYDIYGAKFANGAAEFRLEMGADGKVEDVLFRPDGNDEPGAIVACSNEARLKSLDGTPPIKVMLYNGTGDDILLYNLDSKGNREAHGTLGDNVSSSVMTSVDSPWVVADRAGQCLEILLPGQQTRFHVVEAARPDGAVVHSLSRRSAPLPGSEEMLRQYILALGRGQPDYDRMTSEVATQTRQWLPQNQAILTRLGELRAVSFRGVTAMGSDIYTAHFANGTAEWRIGLAKDGTIGRIALGPQ